MIAAVASGVGDTMRDCDGCSDALQDASRIVAITTTSDTIGESDMHGIVAPLSSHLGQVLLVNLCSIKTNRAISIIAKRRPQVKSVLFTELGAV